MQWTGRPPLRPAASLMSSRSRPAPLIYTPDAAEKPTADQLRDWLPDRRQHESCSVRGDSDGLDLNQPVGADQETGGGHSGLTWRTRTSRLVGMCSGWRPTTERVVFTTSRKVAPAAARARWRFANVCSACARRSPRPTTWPRPSTPTCPETSTVLPAVAVTTCVQPYVG